MEIEELMTLVEVADAGGVSAAARRLGVSKSIVSRRLLRLEAEFGVQLVVRNTRGTALTEAGASFRHHAERIREELDMARQAILPADDLRGRLRVALPLSFGPTHFAPVLAEMALRHPQLHIHSSYSDRFVDIVSEGFDCAVRVGYLPVSNLLARRVGSIRGTLVASPDYIEKNGAPERPEAIGDHQALMQGTEAWQFLDGDQTVSVNPRGRYKADNASALASAAVAGLGIACLPDSIIQEHLSSGALVPVMTAYPLPLVGVYVVRPPSPHAARNVTVLTALLTQWIGSSTTMWGIAPTTRSDPQEWAEGGFGREGGSSGS